MAVVLSGASALTGGLAGFVPAVAWRAARLPSPAPAVAAAVAAVALALEAAWVTRRHPRPPSSRRQVPRAWSRLFSMPTCALLYGARLGVGPLTIVSTWLWWGATVLATSLGPLPGALVGASFGASRAAATLAASAIVERRDRHGAAALLPLEPAVAGVLIALGVVATAALVAAS